MSIIFTGVKVLVTGGKYKGKTARVCSYKENTCTLLADGEFTTIQEITGRLSASGMERPTGNIKREHVVTLDWKTPPSSHFIRNNSTLILTSLLEYCCEQYPTYLLILRRDYPRESPPKDNLGRMLCFPVFTKYWIANKRQADWIAGWWPLYCAAFHDQKPDAAIKIQAEVRKYLKRKDYLEILSFKPDGAGYLKVKEEFEMMAASARPSTRTRLIV
tara:strand:- start:1874 stop:2524 length:651 start_codon:yes stop_codon:yes gene_type:complete